MRIAGPNGAGKTTFFRAHLEPLGLRYINADDLARELDTDAYEAAELAAHVRAALIEEKESFVFETVFSDPAGEKLAFLSGAAAQGYTVVLCFIGLESVELSEARVAQRVLRGGHDVRPRSSSLGFRGPCGTSRARSANSRTSWSTTTASARTPSASSPSSSRASPSR